MKSRFFERKSCFFNYARIRIVSQIAFKKESEFNEMNETHTQLLKMNFPDLANERKGFQGLFYNILLREKCANATRVVTDKVL